MSVPSPPRRTAAASQRVPAPPRPIDPLVEMLPAGTTLYRVHAPRLAERANPGNLFNPGAGDPTRWAFFGDPPVPVLYAARTAQAAVFESVFHDTVPGSFVPAVRYRSMVLSVLRTRRVLRLAQFHSSGLRRLGLHARDLTDTQAESYPQTVEWARAVHDDTDCAGIVWMSRQFNSDACLVLFSGDSRSGPGDLEPLPDHPDRRDFALLPDREWLATLATAVRVTIEL